MVSKKAIIMAIQAIKAKRSPAEQRAMFAKMGAAGSLQAKGPDGKRTGDKMPARDPKQGVPAKKIAEKIPAPTGKQFPVGVAQQTILNKLGITNATGHGHAQNIFDALGIRVGSKREGKKSVPVVEVLSGRASRNMYGDYNIESPRSKGIDLSPISEFIQR